MPTDVDDRIRLAATRLKHEQADRLPFYRHPTQMDWLAAHQDAWLAEITERLSTDSYVPKAAPSLMIPKPKFHWRPGLNIHLDDQLVYHYVALLCLERLAGELEWSQKQNLRLSYPLSETGKKWFRGSPFKAWRDFRSITLERLDNGSTFMVSADVAGYYENIDIGRLIRGVAAVGVESSAVSLLGKLLNKWAGTRGRGIPQGYSPSHLFGEFYLNDVDKSLAASGFEHLRYLDDVRIFCDSEIEARRALHRLTNLLRDKGLNLQTSKTVIQRSGEARVAVEGVTQELHRVSREIGDELFAAVPMEYMRPGDLIRYLSYQTVPDPKNPPTEVLERAWHDFVGAQSFDKTLFHYLLNRLSYLQSDEATDYCLSQILDRPEETSSVLRYLGALPDIAQETIERLAHELANPLQLYDYVRLQILEWFIANNASHPAVKQFCSAHTGHRLLRAHAATYLLSNCEGDHDYNQLLRLAQDETDPLQRATLFGGLKAHAPKVLVNGVLGRVRGESTLMDWAINAS